MRLAGVFILAFVASAVAGLLVYAAASYLPDWDDPAGRGLGEAFRAVLTLGYVILSTVLYGLAVRHRDRPRRLKRALYILLVVPFLVVLLGVVDNGVQHVNWPREGVGMVQMFAPLWIVALAQWLVLHIYLTRWSPGANAVST
jgi:hypothetical protein